jgi:hypothetical protein
LFHYLPSNEVLDENQKIYKINRLDFGLGTFTLPGTVPFFKLHCGVEAKHAIETMENLLPPETMLFTYNIRSHFQNLYFQTQDQAKAANFTWQLVT